MASKFTFGENRNCEMNIVGKQDVDLENNQEHLDKVVGPNLFKIMRVASMRRINNAHVRDPS